MAFKKRKATVKGKNPTVWIPRPPYKGKDGNWYIVVTTTTSGYYRDFLYKQVAER